MAKIYPAADDMPFMIKHMKKSALQKYFRRARKCPALAEPSNNTNAFDRSSLSIGQNFAQGADSRLYHGKWNDQHVAVKVIQVHDQEVDKESCLARLQKQYNQEAGLLSRLRHPNVINFIGAFKQEDVFCIITEYLSEGSLRLYLNKLRSDDNRLSLERVLVFGLDIARGMEYVHSQGIIHQDLKPENILIDNESRLKIADFGVSCEESYSEILECSVGTYRWMAPEMIGRKKSCSRKVDVYSFGLMLYELVSGRMPFADLAPVQIAFAVVNKNTRPDFPEECPVPLKSLIEWCYCADPKRRPEFCQIVNILEQFKVELAHNGTLNQAHNFISENGQKKSLLHRICKGWLLRKYLQVSTSNL